MPIKSYPVIPAKTWWALRNRFKMTMPPRISIHYLQSLLGISEKAAKSILPQLKAIQLLDADGSINERTSLWRDDQQYAAVCEKIRKDVYPSKLIRSIPGPAVNIQAAIRWFVKETGVSINTAKKMTRFYHLLSRADCTENYRFMKTAHSESDLQDVTTAEAIPVNKTEPQPLEASPQRESAVPVNIHIHIPADASAEQIDRIFFSITKHFKSPA